MAESLGNLSVGAHGIAVLADKSVADWLNWTPELPFSVVLSAEQVSGWHNAWCERWQVKWNSLGSSFKLHFQLFPRWRDREILQSCTAWKWGRGAAGPLLGLGCRRVWEMLSVALASPPASVQVMNRKVQSVQAGGNVTFSCRSVTKEDVIQVTWQKETAGAEDNIATYSTINGQKIAKAYVSHVSFAHSELQASAISLHGVTLQDEGCYKCIFNTFPSGAVTGRMCLKVYGKAL